MLQKLPAMRRVQCNVSLIAHNLLPAIGKSQILMLLAVKHAITPCYSQRYVQKRNMANSLCLGGDKKALFHSWNTYKYLIWTYTHASCNTITSGTYVREKTEMKRTKGSMICLCMAQNTYDSQRTMKMHHVMRKENYTYIVLLSRRIKRYVD